MPFTDILFTNDGIKRDLCQAIQIAIKEDRYSCARDYQLNIDILAKKHPEQKEIISTIIHNHIQHMFASMTTVRGFKKLWEMYM